MGDLDLEQRLCYALAPVDPPTTLTDRLELRLVELTGAAADELADWELRAMGDPRNWLRPVAAVAVVGLAGGALVLVRARQSQKKRQLPGLTALERGVRDVVGDVRGRIDRSSIEKTARDVRQWLPRP